MSNTEPVTTPAVRGSGQQSFKQALHPWHFCATPMYDNSGRQRGELFWEIYWLITLPVTDLLLLPAVLT